MFKISYQSKGTPEFTCQGIVLTRDINYITRSC